MSKEVLVTDTLFILPEHEKKIRAAGYEVVRVTKPKSSEAELIELVKGKVGYILGGIEEVTEKVVKAADKLKVISFCGTGYEHFIPAHKAARKKGIKITRAPGSTANAVADFAITLTLAMLRDIFALGRSGDVKFRTTKTLNDVSVGVIGLGYIGTRYAELIRGLGGKEISYYSRTRKQAVEKKLKIKYKTLNDLLKSSDVIYIASSKTSDKPILNSKNIKLIKKGALIVSTSPASLVDFPALAKRIKEGSLRAAFDIAPDPKLYKDLPIDRFYCPNESTAFNTHAGNRLTSTMATDSLLNVLKTGKDKHLV